MLLACALAAALCGQEKLAPPVGTSLKVKDIVSIRYSAFEYETNIPVTRKSILKCSEVLPKLGKSELARLCTILNANYAREEFIDGGVRLGVVSKTGGEWFVGKERQLWRWGRGYRLDKDSYDRLVAMFLPEWDGLPPRLGPPTSGG